MNPIAQNKRRHKKKVNRLQMKKNKANKQKKMEWKLKKSKKR